MRTVALTSAIQNSFNHDSEARKEREMLDEIAFWGIHDFQDALDSLGCRRCGYMFWEPMHTGRLDDRYSY